MLRMCTRPVDAAIFDVDWDMGIANEEMIKDAYPKHFSIKQFFRSNFKMGERGNRALPLMLLVIVCVFIGLSDCDVGDDKL